MEQLRVVELRISRSRCDLLYSIKMPNDFKHSPPFHPGGEQRYYYNYTVEYMAKKMHFSNQIKSFFLP